MKEYYPFAFFEIALANQINETGSACLLGEKVRYDGGHKEDRFLTGTVTQFVEFVPVCPEVEVGMGTPRETVRLVRGDDGDPQVAAVDRFGGGGSVSAHAQAPSWITSSLSRWSASPWARSGRTWPIRSRLVSR